MLDLVSGWNSATLRTSPMSRRTCSCFRVFFVLAFCFSSILGFAADQPRKIVLIAGPITGHPKAAHGYEKHVILLKHLLETSPDFQGTVRVAAHLVVCP